MSTTSGLGNMPPVYHNAVEASHRAINEIPSDQVVSKASDIGTTTLDAAAQNAVGNNPDLVTSAQLHANVIDSTDTSLKAMHIRDLQATIRG